MKSVLAFFMMLPTAMAAERNVNQFSVVDADNANDCPDSGDIVKIGNTISDLQKYFNFGCNDFFVDLSDASSLTDDDYLHLSGCSTGCVCPLDGSTIKVGSSVTSTGLSTLTDSWSNNCDGDFLLDFSATESLGGSFTYCPKEKTVVPVLSGYIDSNLPELGPNINIPQDCTIKFVFDFRSVGEQHLATYKENLSSRYTSDQIGNLLLMNGAGVDGASCDLLQSTFVHKINDNECQCSDNLSYMYV